MPWSPGFQLDRIGMDEARLVAWETLLQSKVSRLNTTLQLAPISLPAGSATTDQIFVGDPYTFPDNFPFVICIAGGGRNNNLDMEIRLKHVGVPVTVSSFKHAVYTRLRVYIHPNTFPAEDQTWASVKAQIRKREFLISRICDWLRADVLELATSLDITLTSKEQQEAGDNFTTDGNSVYVTVSKGLFAKGLGNSMDCPGAEISITSAVQ